MKSTRAISVILFLLASFTLAGTCYSQDIPEEARKHYARGQAAIEMIESEVDYADAILEFETAIQLAPAWADPHYDLGMFQDKIEKYNDAISHLRKYLELAPQTTNASQVQSTIYKIEFKKDKADEIQMMIDLLVNGKRTSTGEFSYGICYPAEFYYKSDQLYVDIICGIEGSHTEYNQTVPAEFDGKTLQFKYSKYHCPDAPGLENYPCEKKIEIVGTVIEKNPLHFAITETVTQTKTNYTKKNEEEWTFSKQ